MVEEIKLEILTLKVKLELKNSILQHKLWLIVSFRLIINLSPSK